jgi:hypothetical protein
MIPGTRHVLGPLLDHLGGRSLAPDDVPIICNVAAALKAVQMLADLKHKIGLVKSNLGVFHPPPAASLANISHCIAR